MYTCKCLTFVGVLDCIFEYVVVDIVSARVCFRHIPVVRVRELSAAVMKH